MVWEAGTWLSHQRGCILPSGCVKGSTLQPPLHNESDTRDPSLPPPPSLSHPPTFSIPLSPALGRAEPQLKMIGLRADAINSLS